MTSTLSAVTAGSTIGARIRGEEGGGGVQPILTIDKYDLKFADHHCINDEYVGEEWL